MRPPLLQGLTLSNNEFLHDAIGKAANYWLNNHPTAKDPIIESLYMYALGRSPSTDEQKLLDTIIGESLTHEKMEDLIWAILLLPEFQFI